MVITPDNNVELRGIVSGFAGESCWALSAVGVWVICHFGEKTARKHIINNPHLDSALRSYEGSLVLDMYCDWQLSRSESAELALITSNDVYWDDDDVQRKLDVIKNNKIIHACLNMEKDLVLQFENELWLHLKISTSTPDSYYCITSPTHNYSVNGDGSVEITPRQYL